MEIEEKTEWKGFGFDEGEKQALVFLMLVIAVILYLTGVI